MISINRSIFSSVYFVTVLATEFYWVEIGGGYLRPYHLMSIVVLFLFIKQVPALFRSPVFLCLALFLVINTISCVLALEPAKAFASLALLVTNIALALSTAVVLVHGRFDVLRLKRLIIFVTILSVFLGLLQVVSFRFGGLMLALSPVQEGNIALGLAPAFRSEANAFGKFLIIPFLLLLPELIRGHRNRKLSKIYVIIILGIFTAFTRSAIYGLILTLALTSVLYILRGKAHIFVGKFAKAIAIACVGLTIFVSGSLNVSEYALHKVDKFTSMEEVLDGNSSRFRIKAMNNTLNAFLRNDKTILIGNGWGQVYMLYDHELIQTGGGDLLVSLGYGGIFGGLLYLFMMIAAFFASMRFSASSADAELSMFGEGIGLSILGMLITGQMAGFFLAPEFWMLIGVTIYFGARSRRRPLSVKRTQLHFAR